MFDASSPWYFFSIVEAWPLSHLYLPFTAYLITRSFWMTMGFVFYNEFFEATTYAIMGSYVVFAGEGDAKETANDSDIGDPVNGMIGILLCWYFTKLFEVPQLFPGPYTIRRVTTHWRYYLKNFVAILALSVAACFLKLHYHRALGQCGLPTGVVVFGVTSVLSVLAMYKMNNNEEDQKFVFEDPPGTLQGVNYHHRFSTKTRFHATYVGWVLTMACASCMFLCSWESGYHIGVYSVLILAGLYTVAWFVLDFIHRRQSGEPFSFGPMIGIYPQRSQLLYSPSLQGKRRNIPMQELNHGKEVSCEARNCSVCGAAYKRLLDDGAADCAAGSGAM